MDDGGGAVEEKTEPLSEEALQLQLATQEKERGTELFKQQKYTEAQAAWNKALEEMPKITDGGLNRLKVSLHLNLAMVGLQLKEYDDVITHATDVLTRDEMSSKAFYRRGLANGALGKTNAAVADFLKAGRLEPRNADIRKKYEEFKKLAADAEAQDDADNPPPVHDVSTLPRAWMEVAVGDQPPARLVFALYKDSAPKTVENFRQLCTGEHTGNTDGGKPFHYKGSILHRILPGLMVQGGDFENANGTGGESIYGRRFEDETFADRPTRRGLLAMANDGPKTNGSQFFVTFAEAEHLTKKHVIFGELVAGLELLTALEHLETDAECRPLVDCQIVDCGADKS